MVATHRSRLYVVSELYHPEETSTAHILTRISEGLADHCAVRVVAGQPSYFRRGMKAPARELRNGVDIRRVSATRLPKDILPFKLINAITFSLAALWALLRALRRGDVVLVVTNPPTLTIVATLACALKRARCVVLLHDMYPDVLVAAKLVKAGSMPARLINGLMRRVHERAVMTVVLGRDMAERLIAKFPRVEGRVTVIENWADEEVAPAAKETNALLRELGLSAKFVLNYTGNMGWPHGVEVLAEAASRLRDDRSIHFLFIGWGARRKKLEELTRDLPNVSVLPPRPRADQQDFLTAGDVALHAFIAGMSGLAVPSRMYNTMAAGLPLIAVAERSSELARVIAEGEVGWIAPPGDVEALVATIRMAAASPEEVRRRGLKAAALAGEKYQFSDALAKYRQLFAGMEVI